MLSYSTRTFTQFKEATSVTQFGTPQAFNPNKIAISMTMTVKPKQQPEQAKRQLKKEIIVKVTAVDHGNKGATSRKKNSGNKKPEKKKGLARWLSAPNNLSASPTFRILISQKTANGSSVLSDTTTHHAVSVSAFRHVFQSAKLWNTCCSDAQAAQAAMKLLASRDHKDEAQLLQIFLNHLFQHPGYAVVLASPTVKQLLHVHTKEWSALVAQQKQKDSKHAAQVKELDQLRQEALALSPSHSAMKLEKSLTLYLSSYAWFHCTSSMYIMDESRRVWFRLESCCKNGGIGVKPFGNCHYQLWSMGSSREQPSSVLLTITERFCLFKDVIDVEMEGEGDESLSVTVSCCRPLEDDDEKKPIRPGLTIENKDEEQPTITVECMASDNALSLPVSSYTIHVKGALAATVQPHATVGVAITVEPKTTVNLIFLLGLCSAVTRMQTKRPERWNGTSATGSADSTKLSI